MKMLLLSTLALVASALALPLHDAQTLEARLQGPFGQCKRGEAGVLCG